MDLSTKYLGLTLPHPLMPGASPLCDSLDVCKRLEDAGAAAIVLRSLFEEQITREEFGIVHDLFVDEESDAAALRDFPESNEFAFSPDRYLDHLRRVKAAVGVPVIASLNGTERSGWLASAKQMEEAGADAIELNIYHVATDPRETGADVERRLLNAVRHVTWAVQIPVAVKLSPFFSSMSNLASELDAVGADGLVLFNRFYQPDIDPEMLLAAPRLHLSTPDELLLRVRWLAILYGRVEASLAATGGVHSGVDALKAVMAGADAVQVVSALLERGIAYLAQMRRELAHWLEEHEYNSLREAQGKVSLIQNPKADAFERGNYMRILHSWRPRSAPHPGKPGAS
ncbi:MAG TPA: dihydroorotate dehydrogenase-like protein [Vicinamibacterales bacterium]|nr:dihydroorotate dehydrogenase-like protein [Vicinamibacterales bacterium]